MKTESENLSAQQSLDLITSMITQAKGKAQKNVFYFLLWGWIVALCNIGMYALYKVDYAYPYAVWLITIPAWLYSMYRGYRQSRNKLNSTPLDRISATLWISFGVIVFTLVAFGSHINYQLNPIILLVASIPTLVSGVILRFRPLIIGGILFWVFGIICFLISPDQQLLMGALAIVCGYLVPGYMLKGHQGDTNA